MRSSPQAQFRKSVKIWLAGNETTVKALAKKIGRRRDTVSTAIHQDRFPRVRAQILEVIAK